MRSADLKLVQKYFTSGVVHKILKLDGALVSLSGGVDSSVILAVLAGILPADRIRALIFKSFLHFRHELDRASAMCEQFGIKAEIIDGPELTASGVMENSSERCAVCKGLRVEVLNRRALELQMTIVDGTNADDVKDPTRLGNRVLSKASNLFSPFAESNLGKQQVRQIGEKLGIPWSFETATACLATRFPVGYTLSEAECSRAGQAEMALKKAGIDARLRVFADTVCIEFPAIKEDHVNIDRKNIHKALEPYGFQRIMIDLDGYRSGRTWLEPK